MMPVLTTMLNSRYPKDQIVYMVSSNNKMLIPDAYASAAVIIKKEKVSESK